MQPKEQLIAEISKILAFSTIDQATASMLVDAIVLTMDKYEVTNRSTAIVPFEPESEQLLQLFIASILTEGKSKGTAKEYIFGCRKARLEIGKPYTKMTAPDIRAWLLSMQQTTTPRTRSNYRSYLSAFFHWLRVENLIDENPMEKVKTIKFPKKKKTVFSDVDIDKLRASCGTVRTRAMLELMLSSGLRVEEISNLTRSDIDIHDLTVFVQEGKGGKSRTSYMSPLAREYLLKYLDTRKDTSPELFRSRENRAVSISQIEKICKQVGKEAGLTDVHPHKFRRTFATNLYKRGMDLRSIQLLMGHSSISTTMEYICTDMVLDRTVRERYA